MNRLQVSLYEALTSFLYTSTAIAVSAPQRGPSPNSNANEAVEKIRIDGVNAPIKKHAGRNPRLSQTLNNNAVNPIPLSSASSRNNGSKLNFTD